MICSQIAIHCTCEHIAAPTQRN